MTTATPRALLLLLGATGVALPLAAQAPALRGLDPVALCQGQEIPGTGEFVASHAGYAYQFASAAHRATFQKEPDRYGVQLGGACARMGPLSGLGDPARFLVYKERIYLFASDGCREGFKKRTDAFLDVTDAAPTPDAANLAAANELLARAAAAHGGSDRLRAMRGYSHERTATKGETTETWRLHLQWPNAARFEHDSMQKEKAWHFAHVVAADTAFFDDNGKGRAMSNDARTEVLRTLAHEPLAALREALEGRARLAAAGKREVLGSTVDELVVWQHGHSTTFGLGADGRIETARFRGRGPGLWFGAVELRFADCTTIQGVTVPTTVRGTFEGKDEPSFAAKRIGLAIDPTFAADTFVRRQ